MLRISNGMSNVDNILKKAMECQVNVLSVSPLVKQQTQKYVYVFIDRYIMVLLELMNVRLFDLMDFYQ